MHRESIEDGLTIAESRSPHISIIGPGEVGPEKAADQIINLLQLMYTQHAISNDRQQLIDDIAAGNVLSWFAESHNRVVATASLVKQTNGWELGRAASIDRGNGVGKRVMLEAALHHTLHHGNQALVAEVRAAADFEGIPSGEATQRICLGLLELVPHAVAPFFAHGNRKRNEPFVMAASDLEPGMTISDRIRDAVRDRTIHGPTPRVRVVQKDPFHIVVPDEQGKSAIDAISVAEITRGCTLFPIEVTDRNMPLIGLLSANPHMVTCGVDRQVGEEGKPILFIATIGNDGFSPLLAPALVSDVVPHRIRADIQNIADRFTRIHESHDHAWRTSWQKKAV